VGEAGQFEFLTGEIEVFCWNLGEGC